MTLTETFIARGDERKAAFADAGGRGGRTAVIAVDMQNDFVLPTGALPVPDGEAILPNVRRLVHSADVAVATRDWHKKYDCSFKGNGGEWPVHCVAGEAGAWFHRDLVHLFAAHCSPQNGMVLSKTDYSGFRPLSDIDDLDAFLWARNVTRVVVCGLALDYCVKATAVDGRRLGYRTYVALDATRAVNPRSIPDIEANFQMQGITLCSTEEAVRLLMNPAG